MGDARADAEAQRAKKLKNIDDLVREDLLTKELAVKKRQEVEEEYRAATQAAGGAAAGEPEWSEHLDEKSGHRFYRHATTGATQWERPAGPVKPLVCIGEWQECKDPKTGRQYWRSSKTGQTQWEKPQEVQATADTGGAAAGGAAAAGEWQQLTDPSSGRPYWRNNRTGESRWDNPNVGTATATATAAGGGEWQQCHDAQSGRPYWRHTVTGESRWDNPNVAGAAAGKGAKGGKEAFAAPAGAAKGTAVAVKGAGKDANASGKGWGKDWGKGGAQQEAGQAQAQAAPSAAGGAAEKKPSSQNYAPPQAFVVAAAEAQKVYAGPTMKAQSPPGQQPLHPGSRVLAAQRRETAEGQVWLLLAPPHKGWALARAATNSYDCFLPETHVTGIKRMAIHEAGPEAKKPRLDLSTVQPHPQGAHIPKRNDLLRMRQNVLRDTAMKYATTTVERMAVPEFSADEVANYLDLKRPPSSRPKVTYNTLNECLSVLRTERSERLELEREASSLNSKVESQQETIGQLTAGKNKAEAELNNLKVQGPRWAMPTPASAGPGGGGKGASQAQVDDLQRRLQHAEQELRSAQQRMAQYQRDLSGIPQAQPAPMHAAGRGVGTMPPGQASSAAGRGGQAAPGGSTAGRGVHAGASAAAGMAGRGQTGAQQQRTAQTPAAQKAQGDAQKRMAALQACARTQGGITNLAEEHLTVLAQQQSTLQETEAWILIGMKVGDAGGKDAAKKMMAKLHPDRVTDEKQKEVMRKRFQLINHARSLMK